MTGDQPAGEAIGFHVIGLPAPQGSKKHVGHGVMVESSKKVKPWMLWHAPPSGGARPITADEVDEAEA